MIRPVLAVLLLGLATAAPPKPPPLCRVVIYRDYSFAVGYYAVPALAPTCPPGSTGRLRKSSTLNTRAAGAAYQPIKPDTGAWTVTGTGDTVPRAEKFVYWFSSWQWQTYDGTRWLPAEVR